MAKNRSRAARRSYRRKRRISAALFLGRKSRPKNGQSKMRSTSRRKKAEKPVFKIREIPKVANDPYEYVVYLFTKWDDPFELHDMHKQVHEFVKTSIAGQYKITKQEIIDYPKKLVGINCIKLELESDLMMLMLCHRPAVRKIFKTVEGA